MMKPKLYAAVHSHEYGTSVRLFLFSPTKEIPMPSEEELVSHLKINFQPELGQTLDICESNDVVDVDAAMGRADSPIDQRKHEYVVRGGDKCFFCGAADLEGARFEKDAHLVRQRVVCLACGAEWTDVWGLVEVEEVS